MRDKNARQRLLIAEQKIERLENIIRDTFNAQNSIINQEMSAYIPYGSCVKCNVFFYDGYICQDSDCPHGLDEGE